MLGAVHFFIQSKLNIYEPVLMAGFLFWLLAYRVLYRRNNERDAAAPPAPDVRGDAVTALGEAAIYMATSGVNAWRILLAHFDIDMEIRPAWWVLAAGLAVAALGWWRWKPARQRAERAQDLRRRMSGATQVQSGS